MAIYFGSRYASAKITAIKYKDGKVKKFVHGRKVFTENDIRNRSSIEVIDGSMELDLLSYNHYNNELKYWFIADVNNILFPLYDSALIGPNQVHIGSSIYIPSIDDMRQLT